jgi:uncharacterized protein (DUF1697 family)
MPCYGAFLRAVNVGGTGKLPMAELKLMCETLGFKNVKTYIASGNVVFDTEQGEAQIRQALLEKLSKFMGKPVPVFVRAKDELSDLLSDNPFPHVEENKHMVIFLDETPPADISFDAKHHIDELIAIRTKVLHVYYPSGMGKSKLKIVGTEQGTARNMNTVRKVLELMDQA